MITEAIIESAKRILLAVTLFLLVVGTGVTGWFVLFETNPSNSIAARLARPIGHGSVNFSYELYARLAESHIHDDFVFSPFSLEVALLQLRAAANDETQAQIARMLYPGVDLAQVSDREEHTLALRRELTQLTMANRLWVQRDFDLTDSYLKFSEQKFGVMPGLVEFKTDAEAARVKINRWSYEHAMGISNPPETPVVQPGGSPSVTAKSDNLLQPGAIDGLTDFLLTSVVRFSAAWSQQFHSDQTEPGEFTLQRGGRTVTVPFLHSEDTYQYAETPDFKLVELPYEGNAVSLLLILPREPNGLQRLETMLTSENVAVWTAGMKMRKVSIALPKFTLSKVISLPIILNYMGMSDAFDSTHADFSKLTGRRDIFLNSVIHKAVLTVAEYGGRQPENSMSKMLTDAGGRAVTFEASHAFIFLIRHRKTNTILLMGHLTDPRD